MEGNNSSKHESNVGMGMIELTKSFSRIEAWLEISATRQLQILCHLEGKEFEKEFKGQKDLFDSISTQKLKEYIAFIFPTLPADELWPDSATDL